jgi:hypothetical protein
MRCALVTLFFPLLLLIFYPAENSYPQKTRSGALTGVVTDSINAEVPSARVELRSSAKATAQSTKANRGRRYRFFPAVHGHVRCTLTLTPNGFRRENRNPLQLRGSVRRERVCDEVPF